MCIHCISSVSVFLAVCFFCFFCLFICTQPFPVVSARRSRLSQAPQFVPRSCLYVFMIVFVIVVVVFIFVFCCCFSFQRGTAGCRKPAVRAKILFVCLNASSSFVRFVFFFCCVSFQTGTAGSRKARNSRQDPAFLVFKASASNMYRYMYMCVYI